MASAPPNQPFLQSPPAYGTTPTYYAVPSPPVVVVVREDRQRTNARFCRALFWGIVIWVLLSGLIRSYIELISWHHGRHHHPWWSAPWEYQIPGDVNLDNCTPKEGWTDIRRHNRNTWRAETNFDLPLTSETLYFLSRGDMSGGGAEFLIDPELKEDQVHINVVIRYTDDFLRDLAKVCEVSRGKNENGVGIFTPHYFDGRPRNSYMWFETKIFLPSSASDYVIKNLETDLPNTVHELQDLSPYFFKHIQLRGSNTPITAASLHFQEASIQTSNGPIHGVYNTTDSLVLRTSNSVIDVEVGATASKDVAPKVVLSTSNSPFRANISLFSDTHSGEYEVTTSTSNSPLSVSFLTQPVDTVLGFSASTSNSPASATMHPLFEGNFDVHSTLFGPTVKFDPFYKDPSGRGRKRSVSMDQNKRDIRGWVSWDESRDLKGHASLKTTNSPATLSF